MWRYWKHTIWGGGTLRLGDASDPPLEACYYCSAMWDRFSLPREGGEVSERIKAGSFCAKGIIAETGRFLR
jgi:hypothetical protein